MGFLPGSDLKFTAIWQSDSAGSNWPFFYWLKRIFEPYISENIFDGAHSIVKDNAIVFDAWVYANDSTYYAQFRGKNAFLVHTGDEFYELGVEHYRHFRGVFRMIWSSVFDPRYVMTIPLGTYLKQAPATVSGVEDRRYAWSFIGDAGKVSRPDMVRAFSPLEPHICFSSTAVRGVSFLGEGKRMFSQPEFFEILGQSVFAPAPMGNATIESCRPYDALEMGAIPIVERRLTLDYYRELLGDHPLPTVRSWSEGRKLAEGLLRDPAELKLLHGKVMRWWSEYQLKLITGIGNFLRERSNTIDDLVPLQSRLPELPFWQYFELARHHNAPALYRRVERQVRRLLRERRWRVATRRGVPPV